MEAIIFLLLFGATIGLMNWGVYQGSNGQFQTFFDALFHAISQGIREIEKQPPLVQLIVGPILGLLNAAARFLNRTTEQLVGKIDNIGSFLSNVAETFADATFQAFEKVSGSVSNLTELIRDAVEEKLTPVFAAQKQIEEQIKQTLEKALPNVSATMEKVQATLEEKLDEQILQAREVTTNIEYALREQAADTIEELKRKFDETARAAVSELDEALTIADSTLNREVFTTALEMKMWSDLFDVILTVDEKQMKENLKKQVAVYQELYLETLRQYKALADLLKTNSVKME